MTSLRRHWQTYLQIYKRGVQLSQTVGRCPDFLFSSRKEIRHYQRTTVQYVSYLYSTNFSAMLSSRGYIGHWMMRNLATKRDSGQASAARTTCSRWRCWWKNPTNSANRAGLQRWIETPYCNARLERWSRTRDYIRCQIRTPDENCQIASAEYAAGTLSGAWPAKCAHT